jgi:hypothetical protein
MGWVGWVGCGVGGLAGGRVGGLGGVVGGSAWSNLGPKTYNSQTKWNTTSHVGIFSSNCAGGHRKSTQHSEKALNEKALNIAQPLGARAPDYAK